MGLSTAAREKSIYFIYWERRKERKKTRIGLTAIPPVSIKLNVKKLWGVLGLVLFRILDAQNCVWFGWSVVNYWPQSFCWIHSMLWYFLNTFLVFRGWNHQTLVISWWFLECYQQVKCSLTLWSLSTSLWWIDPIFCSDIHGSQMMCLLSQCPGFFSSAIMCLIFAILSELSKHLFDVIHHLLLDHSAKWL